MCSSDLMFENVGGLLRGKWTRDGRQGEIWEDVQSDFEMLSNYNVRWQLVRSKDYGVPQNRPRVILVGLRKDFDFEPDSGFPADGLLPKPTGGYPEPYDLLGDLVDPRYLGKKSTNLYPSRPKTSLQKKFRTLPNGKILGKGAQLTEQEYSKHSERIRKKFSYMLKHSGKIPEYAATRKFSQRIIPKKWGSKGPNITLTSLPDDYVHFSQPRCPTVREWARLQTFPDWYVFAGKRTTGGQKRGGNPHEGNWSRDTPKYTQIGNAVPVKLAEVLGRHFLKITS